MAIILPSLAPLVVGIPVMDFSERDRLHAGSVTRPRQELAQLRRALEESNRGVISLTDKGRVWLCTERAQRWLSEYFEPSRQTDRLPESPQRWVEHQQSLLSENGDVPPPREPLILPVRHATPLEAANFPTW